MLGIFFEFFCQFFFFPNTAPIASKGNKSLSEVTNLWHYCRLMAAKDKNFQLTNHKNCLDTNKKEEKNVYLFL